MSGESARTQCQNWFAANELQSPSMHFVPIQAVNFTASQPRSLFDGIGMDIAGFGKNEDHSVKTVGKQELSRSALLRFRLNPQPIDSRRIGGIS